MSATAATLLPGIRAEHARPRLVRLPVREAPATSDDALPRRELACDAPIGTAVAPSRRPAVAHNPTPAETDPTDHLDPDVLVRQNMPLVGHSVREALSRLPAHVSRDDLVSAGMLALVQASRSFDAERGVPFVCFANRRIRGAILDELRHLDWASRSVRRRERELDEARTTLSATLGRLPSAVEMASATGLSTTQLAEHRSDLARACLTSLHAVSGDALDGMAAPRSVEPDVVLLHRERMAYLRDAVATLPDRLRLVVEGYFFDDRPMAGLAEELGVTESRISQLRAEALVLLRHALDAVLENASVAPAGGAVGIVHRRRAEYVARLSARRTVAERLAYVPETELGLPA
jgi:RNA polymerase sigma factor for flagellar operon FliA